MAHAQEQTPMARVYQSISGQRIEYGDPDPKLEKFLQRAQSLVDDRKATDADLVSLIYGTENPLLAASGGLVTSDVLDKPVYHVLADLIVRKRGIQDAVDWEQAAAKYTLSVAAAAERKGVTEDAIRKAARARRLPSWVKGGAYFFDPRSLDAVAIGGRGPFPAATEPLEMSYGFAHLENAFLKVKHDGTKIAEITPEMHRGAGGASMLSLTVDRWRRVAVLTAAGGKARMFVLVPSSNENEITFYTFYVRGKFDIEHKINNAKAAREEFEAFRAS